jgi:glycine cleavage system H protein
MEYPDELRYTEEHEWVLVEAEIVTIGISAFAQEQLGDIVFVELPEVGDDVEMGKSMGVVESVKAVSDVYSPVSGEVIEVNDDLPDEPDLLNNSPYEDGWMVKIKPNDLDELDELMDAQTYREFIEQD